MQVPGIVLIPYIEPDTETADVWAVCMTPPSAQRRGAISRYARWPTLRIVLQRILQRSLITVPHGAGHVLCCRPGSP